jgi:iron complex outermembrane receptor protein
MSMFDVGRVEVLKGPQGGIYGRNTSAGAVRIISNLAEFGPTEGVANASLGTWNTKHISAAVGGTLAPETLAGRLAFDATGGGGNRMHLLSSGSDWGRQDKQAVRGSLLWQLAPGARFTFIGEFARDKSQVLPNTAVGYKAANSAALCGAVLSGSLDNANCRTWADFSNSVLFGRTGTNKASQQDPGRTALADPFGVFDVKSNALSANGEFDLGNTKLVSITHVRGFDYGRGVDNDAVTGEFGQSVSMSKFKIASQEFRLQSTRPGALQWIVGTSFMRDDLTEDRLWYFRDNASKVANFTNYGVTSASQLIARVAYKQRTDSTSIFGQTDYALADKLNLGVAIRWTDERKQYRDGGFNFPSATGAINPAYGDNVNYRLAADYKLQSNWSGKVSLDWKPIDGLMTYGSISSGFKVGGFFGGFPLSAQQSIMPYKEERVMAYEVGAKTDAANRRIGGSVALYHYDYQDAQNFTAVFSSLLGTNTSVLTNVGRAAHDGVDLEGWWRPVSRLRLTASLSLLNARFLDDVKYKTLDGITASYQGQKRPFAPKRSWVLGADYDIPTDGGTLRLGMDVNSRTDLMQSFGSDVDRALYSIPGYTLVNLRSVFTTANGKLQYGLSVRNVADKRYVLTYNNDGLGDFARFYGEPRTLRAEMTYRF